MKNLSQKEFLQRRVDIPLDELEDILNFLTDFAKKDRYYKFGISYQNGGADPIKRWRKLVTQHHPMPALTEEQRDEMRKADMCGEEGVYFDMLFPSVNGNNIERPSE